MKAKLNTIYRMLTALLLVYNSTSRVFAMSSENELAGDKLLITGTEFYQRSQFDAGEIRIFLKNNIKEPLSSSQLKVIELLNVKDEELIKTSMKMNYLYSKLSPPILMPGQNGEILVKLLKTPPDNSKLKCTIYGKTDLVSETLISIKQAPIWISYVGFSEDLRKVYVYGMNNTQTPLSIQLVEVAGVKVSDDYLSINNDLRRPGDKGCLILKTLSRLAFGEYVHIAIFAESNGQEFQTHRIVRVVNKFPILPEDGALKSDLGLDSKNFFVQTMSCPAHAHGTHEEAARKFLDDYYYKFAQNPYLLIQMWICRSGSPRAWYEFGALPDAAVMNPVLLRLQSYKSGTETSNQCCPFFWLASNAKKATEPNRYFACIPVNPEDVVFLQSNHTPEEIKFLVYCAIAAGAKGILYRGTPSSDQLDHDAFVRMSRELRQLKPLLIIAEPVNWALSADNNYVAESLLCGDESILVMVFDRRYFSEQQNNRLYTPVFPKSLKPVKIQVKIPEGFLVSQVESMYSPLPKRSWKCQERKLDFTASMIDSVHVYKLILRRDDSK
jgi:hypothetical protein